MIYPPVDVDAFEPGTFRDDYYIAVSRLAPHKRIEVLIDAFRELPHRLLVVGDGPERDRLASRAPANVEVLGRRPHGELRELLGRARAFVHAAEEDFGIALVEAQAAGCPVVAYERGGAAEIVVPGRTGLLFSDPTPGGVAAAIRRFESARSNYRVAALVENARRFSRDRFQREFSSLLEREWDAFRESARPRHGGNSRRDTEAA